MATEIRGCAGRSPEPPVESLIGEPTSYGTLGGKYAADGLNTRSGAGNGPERQLLVELKRVLKRPVEPAGASFAHLQGTRSSATR